MMMTMGTMSLVVMMVIRGDGVYDAVHVDDEVYVGALEHMILPTYNQSKAGTPVRLDLRPLLSNEMKRYVTTT